MNIKYISRLAAMLFCACTVASCSDDDLPELAEPTFPEITPTNPDGVSLGEYVCPSYIDDYANLAASAEYSDISGWTNRRSWNLANVHDPSVVKAADGYYYMYQTDASYGNAHNDNIYTFNDGSKLYTKHGHFFCRRSKNLVDWEFMGETMVGLPSWIKDKLNEIRTSMGVEVRDDSYFENDLDFGYWAPCVRKVSDNLYRMYYCITCPGTINGDGTWSERAFIGLMETSDPSDVKSWEDKGYVITNASDKELNFDVSSTDYTNCYFKFNAIDPSYIITPDGEHWLIYGSWHSGFAAVQIDPNTGKTLATLPDPFGTDAQIADYGKLIFTRTAGNRWQGSEAPEVVYRNGYYYLFVAYDALDVPYNTRVLRSTNVDGPYVSMDGAVSDAALGANDSPTVLTHPYKFGDDNGWVGISHCAVFNDGDNWYYVSQQRFPSNAYGSESANAIMMGGVRSIQWINDWPVVMPERYGAVPQETISQSELTGEWEHIDLAYQYGVQQASTTITLNADGTATGALGTTWSFDASSNTLTIGGTALKVQREVDWEASPRKVTIVYAGLSGSKSLWGKKK